MSQFTIHDQHIQISDRAYVRVSDWREGLSKEAADVIEHGKLKVQFMENDMPIMSFNQTTEFGEWEQYWDGNIVIDDQPVGDFDYVKIQAIVTNKNNGQPSEIYLTAVLCNAYQNGYSNSRFLFEEGYPVEEINSVDSKIERLIERCNSGDFDLTSQWILDDIQRNEVADFLAKELPPGATQAQYKSFCERFDYKALTTTRLLEFNERYSSRAAGKLSKISAIDIAAKYQRIRAIFTQAESVLSGVSLPLSRHDYEAACQAIGIEALSDGACVSAYENGFSFLRQEGAAEWPLNLQTLHAYRGVDHQKSVMALPTAIKKQGQLWEPCRCGVEPVYLPLHLCDKCWPSEGE